MRIDPARFEPSMDVGETPSASPTEHGYRFSREVVLTVKAALAAGRPLLIEGPPGSGKSSLARAIANELAARYYETVVTSRTQAQDLLWSWDAVRRLNDAHANAELGADHDYVTPRVLWWAFSPETALRRGAGEHQPVRSAPTDPALDVRPSTSAPLGPDAVVLLDEIDKADPDMPNDLLVPLDTGTFRVHDTHDPIVRTRNVLLVVTTNGERSLPAAFQRRCVLLTLETPGEEDLVRIAQLRCGGADDALYRSVAKWVIAAAAEQKRRGERAPSTAEFLDAVRACIDLKLSPAETDPSKKAAFELLGRAVALKSGPAPRLAEATVA